MVSLLSRLRNLERFLPLDGPDIRYERTAAGARPHLVAQTAAPSSAALTANRSADTVSVTADYWLDFFGVARHNLYHYSIDVSAPGAKMLVFFHRFDINPNGLGAAPGESPYTPNSGVPLYWAEIAYNGDNATAQDALTAALGRKYITYGGTTGPHPISGWPMRDWITVLGILSVPETGTPGWLMPPANKNAIRRNGRAPDIFAEEDLGRLSYRNMFSVPLIADGLPKEIWISGGMQAMPSAIYLSEPTVGVNTWKMRVGSVTTETDGRVSSFAHLDIVPQALQSFFYIP